MRLFFAFVPPFFYYRGGDPDAALRRPFACLVADFDSFVRFLALYLLNANKFWVSSGHVWR